MKTEFEKMRSQELYHIDDPEIQRSCIDTKELLLEFNQTTLTSPNFRSLLQRVVPGIPDSSVICPPFYCDHASSNHIGEHVFINYNCTFLGGAIITIGNHVLIGPNCQLLTPQHPMNYLDRRKPMETSYPITIGDDTWLGGGVTVLPGVTIGKRCIIGAGAVVVHDIPDDSLAVGNPAVVKRRLDREDTIKALREKQRR